MPHDQGFPPPTTGLSRVVASSAVSPPHVLLVNDTPDLRRWKRLILERAGYVVAEVEDGITALVSLRESSRPLIGVMNTRIPGHDGAGILRTVASEPPLQRHAFALTTALVDHLPKDLIQLTQQLRVPIVGKPFTEQELLGTVAGAVALPRATAWSARASYFCPTPATQLSSGACKRLAGSRRPPC